MRFRTISAACALLTLAAVAPTWAQEPANAEYEKVITERTSQVLAKLALTEEAKSARVGEAVKAYYRGIRDVDADRDAALNKLKSAAPADDAQKKAVEDARALAQGKAEEVVTRMSETLAADLTPEQVEAIKDHLTYGVREITIRAYSEMLPNLTDAQKLRIREMLGEARDKALTGGSSGAKHGWFGKYKGRINNYLAKEGYDLKQASNDWADRRKQATSQPAAK